MEVYLNSFKPLCATKQGRLAVQQFSYPPFIDGSCRREPDFQHPFPAITQLCRPGKLLPRLNIGDLVMYITKQGKYNLNYPNWKVIGILEVIDLIDSHTAAESYYKNNHGLVSQNVMCKSTNPKQFAHTHGDSGFNNNNMPPARTISIWDNFYQSRANNYPRLAITQVYDNNLNLYNPKTIDCSILRNIFRKIPGTQNSKNISLYQMHQILQEMY